MTAFDEGMADEGAADAGPLSDVLPDDAGVELDGRRRHVGRPRQLS